MKSEKLMGGFKTGLCVVLVAVGMFACSSPDVSIPTGGGGSSSSSGGSSSSSSGSSGSSSSSSGSSGAVVTPSGPDTPPVAQNPAGSGEANTASIDNTVGGSVTLSDGTKLEIPAGALPAGVTTISITSARDPAPAEYAAASPLYIFGPEGAVFSAPVTISFPFTARASTTDLTVLWSRSNGPGYDMLTTSLAPTADATKFIASALVHHFSTGCVGRAYTTDPHPGKDPYQE